MKFIVSSSVLLKNLQIINGVVMSNPIVPILENFLFRLEKQQLTATASDLQTTFITQLPVETADTGSFAVPAKLLLDTLRSLPEQPITVTVNTDTFGVVILTDNGKFKLSGENPIDFPKIPEVKKVQTLALSSDTLLKAINYTVFATSTDELRAAMNGVLLQVGAGATFVATDGNRIARYRRTDIQAPLSVNVVIPRKALSLLKGSLPEGVEVTIDLSLANASFQFNSTKLICRLIDDKFPDYEGAIPTNNPNVMMIGRTDLLTSLKRIMIYANRATHQIRLSLKTNSLTISAEDLNYANEADEKLLCEYEGEDMEIGFNAKLLSETLGILSAKIISLEMSAPNRAGLIIPADKDDEESILMLVAPVMLNTFA